MTKQIFNIGEVVAMGSGFCVATSILDLHHFGMYRHSLIKKHISSWPKHVPGKAIDELMQDWDLGHAATYKRCIDGKVFHVQCQKDDQYATKIMSTHRLLLQEDHTTYQIINVESKRASTMLIPYHDTTKVNIGFTMLTISNTIPLD